ncbi:hypothetical protein GCM10010145_63760 [Streptomyces ruber]|uniref:Uncharacterized protein n=2 Tax=Streptomyces TaxID=1883 RepID=A0A918EY89_9ACTN|nr:hypothetical protein GCM10010145_63760 [Streptomyces ruber]
MRRTPAARTVPVGVPVAAGHAGAGWAARRRTHLLPRLLARAEAEVRHQVRGTGRPAGAVRAAGGRAGDAA